LNKIEYFTLHNNKGISILAKDLLKWVDPYDKKNDVFAPIISYSWMVNGTEFKVIKHENNFWYVLPDCSGFICFECDRTLDNCMLLDVYGKEFKRLSVPWELTKHPNPESAKSPTAFASNSTACINPVDGKQGAFGITAWVEYAGKYYFELDYHAGTFLWGTQIRD